MQRDKAVSDAKIANEQYNTLTGNIRGNVDIYSYNAASMKTQASEAEATMKKYTIIMAIVTAISTLVTFVVSFFKGFFDIFKPAKT